MNELTAPVPRNDPDYRKANCIDCNTRLCVDEAGAACQDCRGLRHLLFKLLHISNFDRALWTAEDFAAHELRIQGHEQRVGREIGLIAEAV